MRPRPEEYLIVTSNGKSSRRFVWTGEDGIDLDLPKTWRMQREGKELKIHTYGMGDGESHTTLTAPPEGESTTFKLPYDPNLKGHRPLQVTLSRLKPIRPVYTTNPTPQNLKYEGHKQLCAFYGQRYFLIRYRPIGPIYNIAQGNGRLFGIERLPDGFRITATAEGLVCNVAGHKTAIPSNHSLTLSNVDFYRACFIHGINWWRFRMVPTPDGLPPLETDESEADWVEARRLHRSIVGFLATFALAMIALGYYSATVKPEPKVIATEVILQKPLIVPPPKIAKKEEPKPTPTPAPTPEPPKPVVKEPEPVKKPEKKVVEKPKPEKKPKKVVEKAKPEKKIAKVAPTKKPQPKEAPAPKAPAPVEKPVVQAPPPPSPAEIRAKEEAMQKAQLMKSLSFVSGSSSRPKAAESTYNVKEGKFAASESLGDMQSKTNTLDKLAKNGAGGGGKIESRSSRTIASNVTFGGRGKGLNDVQGKVSMNELSSAGSGDLSGVLGGAQGIEISGPGTISQSLIEKALEKYLSRFQYCYEKSLLKNANLAGTLVLQWDISEAGKVLKPNVIKSQLNQKELHSCIIGVLKEVTFPKPTGGAVNVKKVLSFSSSSL